MLRIEYLLPVVQYLNIIRHGAVRPGDRHSGINLPTRVQAGQGVVHHAQGLAAAVTADVGGYGPTSAHGPAGVRLAGERTGRGGHVLGGGSRLALVSVRVLVRSIRRGGTSESIKQST